MKRRLLLIGALTIFCGCAALNQARQDPIATNYISQLAGMHLTMIDEFTLTSTNTPPPVSELHSTCRDGNRMFRQAIFYADNISGKDSTRSQALENLGEQFHDDCSFIEKNLKKSDGLSRADADRLISTVTANYNAALNGEKSRNGPAK